VVREEIGYAKTAYGARADLTRRFTPRYEAGVFLEAAAVTVESLGIDPLELGPPDYLITSVGLTQTLDFRDNALNPGAASSRPLRST
jgi:hypothetical protein